MSVYIYIHTYIHISLHLFLLMLASTHYAMLVAQGLAQLSEILSTKTNEAWHLTSCSQGRQSHDEDRIQKL